MMLISVIWFYAVAVYRWFRGWDPLGTSSRHGFFVASAGIMGLLWTCVGFYSVTQTINAWVWEGHSAQFLLNLALTSSMVIGGIQILWRTVQLYESTEFGSPPQHELKAVSFILKDSRGVACLNYLRRLMRGTLIGAGVGASLGGLMRFTQPASFPDVMTGMTVFAVFGSFAGCLIGTARAVYPRNPPRWLSGCVWIGGGMLLGGPAFHLIGAFLPAWLVTRNQLVVGTFSIMFGPLIGASVGGLVFSELGKRRVERNGSSTSPNDAEGPNRKKRGGD
jgi:hypothetical protein